MEWQTVDPDKTAPRGNLIWICTVCKAHFVRNFGVWNFRSFTILNMWRYVLLPFQDKLYRYMEERYLVSDIMYLCTFDFINAVIKFAETDKVLWSNLSLNESRLTKWLVPLISDPRFKSG